MVDEIAVDSFLNLLGQSDLLPDDQLLALLDRVRSEGMTAWTSKQLAEWLVQQQTLTAWQADNLLKGKNRGFRLGPYRILRPLGQGGMSKVFLAEHETMRRRCAIKILPTKYQEDADLLKRFQLEAVAIAALDHPNIVRAYDFNKDERYGKQIPYLVMEYVEGQDLRRMVEEQGPLDYRKAADFICQAAEGLVHAHKNGFVHRDIKPANLLVDPQGVLKILDLGLAADQSLNDEEGGQTAVGTADYVAPEQVVDSRNVDGRADIYSLGLTFYFLLTGRRPFVKSTIMELLMAHRNEKPEPITNSRPDVPMDLEAIVDKMTAKSPFQRYQTARDLVEKLRKWLKESGSAKTYSRISALMADALRAKQPSTQDTTRAAAVRTEDTELELAKFADENAPVEADAVVAASRGSITAQRSTAEAPRNDKTASAATAATVPSSTGGPVDGNGETKADAVKPQPLPGLPMEDLLASLPPAEPLPPTAPVESSKSHGKLKAIKKPQSNFREFLKTPWPWVGVAGVVFLAVLTFLFVLIFTLPSPNTPAETGSPIVRPSAPRAKSRNAAPSKQSSPAPSTSSAQANKSELPPPAAKVKQAPVKSDVNSQATPVVKPLDTPPATKGVPPPQTAPVVGPPVKPPKPVVAETTKPEEPTKAVEPQPQPKEEVDTDALLADLKSMSIQMQSEDSDQNSPINMTIRQRAEAAAKTLRINIVEKDPPKDSPVMAIELKANTTSDTFELMMVAKVSSPDPDGKMVIVWEHSAPVLSGNAKKLGQVMGQSRGRAQLARTVIYKNANSFFSKFRGDVVKARGKAGAVEDSADE